MANIVCQDGTIQYESLEILGNDSNFLKKLLMDICCNATIIIHLVDPETGFVKVSFIGNIN